MKHIPATNSPSATGPEATFTGQVRIDGLFTMPAPAQGAAGIVTFDPGARTAWHTHPKGQLLLVLSGVGWMQVDGQPRQTIRAGDTVWFEPNEKHWHGASADKAMSHVAVQEAENGSPVDWMEHVSDAEYLGGAGQSD